LPPNQFCACKPYAPDFTSFPWILLAPIRFRSVIPSREQERAANFSFGLVFVTAGKVKLLIFVAVCVVLGSHT
jgi:hypothetical protein